MDVKQHLTTKKKKKKANKEEEKQEEWQISVPKASLVVCEDVKRQERRRKKNRLRQKLHCVFAAEAITGRTNKNPKMSPGKSFQHVDIDAEVLLYVHRNRRLIRDGSPGRLPRLPHKS